MSAAGATCRVAVVGVGNMGGAIAQRLLDQRWPVQVFDIDAAKVAALQSLGATAGSDAAAAVMACEVLIVCVVDAGQIDDVLFGAHGAAHVMLPGQTVLLFRRFRPKTSRISPDASPSAGYSPSTHPCPAALLAPATAP